MSLQPHETIEATFQPRTKDTLKPECLTWIGHRCLWQVLWIIDEDNSKYVGEAACMMLPIGRDSLPYWVPSGDLFVHRIAESFQETTPHE